MRQAEAEAIEHRFGFSSIASQSSTPPDEEDGRREYELLVVENEELLDEYINSVEDTP